MPSRRIHNMINKIILGKTYDDVNRLIDLPWLWLRGKHRKYFHDIKTTPLIIALLKRDWKAGLAAYLHILADKVTSKRKSRNK